MKKNIQEISKKFTPFTVFLIIALVLLLFFSVLRASLFTDVQEDKKIWFELSLLLLAAVMAELLVVYLKQPTVMVLLLVGVAISPSAIKILFPFASGILIWLLGVFGFAINQPSQLPHLIPTEGVVKVFAQLGAILLLFKIGLHSKIKQIFNLKNLIVGLLGVIIPFFAGFYYASMTGHGFSYSMFLGAALTATSVGVTVAVLSELKVMEKEFSKVILGAAVIDDILALLVLSLINNFPTELNAQILSPLATVVFTAFIFVVGGILVGQRIVKRYFDKELDVEKISNSTFLGILAYVLAYSYVAEFIGLSAIVGAFIAGITLNFSRLTGKLFELFYPLEAFFTPIFFISLGMLVDIPALLSNLVPIIIITIIAILVKIIGCGFGAYLTGTNLKESLIVGIGMVPRGEIALIIGLYGLTALTADGTAVLSETEYAIIASMAFITTIIIPWMLKKALGAVKNAPKV
ncbi:cation:proton antiporter [Candidatus Micrarchaeota archaeon]|nr:cation:proton antiporter [Candidatus Micrarchaeota archaeon]